MRRHFPKILTIIGITFILVLVTILYLDWRMPRATATIQLHPAILVFSGQRNRSYMENHFELILSKNTINRAAQILDLNPDDKTLKEIANKVEATPVRGTDFIEITAKNSSHEQAVKIANALAEAYAQLRASETKTRAKKALKALDNELTAQEILVQKHHQEFKTTSEKNKVTVTSNPFDPATYKLQPEDLIEPIDGALRIHNVNQANESYQQSRNILREMKIKQEEARALLKEPRAPITIHNRAQ